MAEHGACREGHCLRLFVFFPVPFLLPVARCTAGVGLFCCHSHHAWRSPFQHFTVHIKKETTAYRTMCSHGKLALISKDTGAQQSLALPLGTLQQPVMGAGWVMIAVNLYRTRESPQPGRIALLCVCNSSSCYAPMHTPAA